MVILLAAFVAVNALLFCAMGWDKSCAIRGAWRVPEKVLFALAVCGGAAGGVLAMQLFRHKTQHWHFKYGFPALAAVQLLALAGAAVR